MYLIENNNITDPAVNLALEEFCLRRLPWESGCVLFYVNRPSVILGRHQVPCQEADLYFCAAHDIQIVRRMSGGGAVYHDPGNLNFSFVTRYRRSWFHNFPLFTAPVVSALRGMGLPFTTNKGNAIFAAGKKLSGNAQFSNTRRMISHGTLLVNARLDTLRKALLPTFEVVSSRGISSQKSEVANMADHMGGIVDMAELRRRLIKTVEMAWGRLTPFRLSPDDWNRVRTLADEKYRQWSWNFGKSPYFRVNLTADCGNGPFRVEIGVDSGLISRVDFDSRATGPKHGNEVQQSLLGRRFDPETVSGLTLSKFRFTRLRS